MLHFPTCILSQPTVSSEHASPVLLCEPCPVCVSISSRPVCFSCLIQEVFTHLGWITLFSKLPSSFTAPFYRVPTDTLGHALLDPHCSVLITLAPGPFAQVFTSLHSSVCVSYSLSCPHPGTLFNPSFLMLHRGELESPPPPQLSVGD